MEKLKGGTGCETGLDPGGHYVSWDDIFSNSIVQYASPYYIPYWKVQSSLIVTKVNVLHCIRSYCLEFYNLFIEGLQTTLKTPTSAELSTTERANNFDKQIMPARLLCDKGVFVSNLTLTFLWHAN